MKSKHTPIKIFALVGIVFLSIVLITIVYANSKDENKYCSKYHKSEYDVSTFQFAPKVEVQGNKVTVCFGHLSEYLNERGLSYSKIKVYRNGLIYKKNLKNTEIFIDKKSKLDQANDYVIEFLDRNQRVLSVSEPSLTPSQYRKIIQVRTDESLFDWIYSSKYDEKTKLMLKEQVAQVLAHLSYAPITSKILDLEIESVILDYQPQKVLITITDKSGNKYYQDKLTGPYIWVKFSAAFNQHSYFWDESIMSWYFLSILPDISLSTLDFWYSMQIKNGRNKGLIPRELRTNEVYRVFENPEVLEKNINPVSYVPLTSLQVNNPFLLSKIELDYYKISSDSTRIKTRYTNLLNYFQWVENNRKLVDKSTNCPYYAFSNLGSGMDNSMRGYGLFNPQLRDYSWVDLFAQQVFLQQDLSTIRSNLSEPEVKLESDNMLDMFLRCNKDTSDGIFRDRNLQTGEFIHHPETAAFIWSLLIRYPDRSNIEQLLNLLRDENMFGGYPPLPSVSRRDPIYNSRGNYWQGGVWPPLIWVTLKGIELDDSILYSQISENTVRMISEVYEDTKTVFEYYSPTAIDSSAAPGQSDWGNYNARPDFYGWGAIAIPLLYENSQKY